MSIEDAAFHEAINNGVMGKHSIYRSDGNMSVSEAEFIRGFVRGRASVLNVVKLGSSE